MTAKKTASRETTSAPKPGSVVTYKLPSGSGTLPAILGDGYVTVFAPTGPYVAKASKGTKAGEWH